MRQPREPPGLGGTVAPMTAVAKKPVKKAFVSMMYLDEYLLSLREKNDC